MSDAPDFDHMGWMTVSGAMRAILRGDSGFAIWKLDAPVRSAIEAWLKTVPPDLLDEIVRRRKAQADQLADLEPVTAGEVFARALKP